MTTEYGSHYKDREKEDELMKQRRGKGGRGLMVALLAFLMAVTSVVACNMKSVAPGTAAASVPMCACFTDPTGNWRCSDPFVNISQGGQQLAQTVGAWLPVLATIGGSATGHPEIGTIVNQVLSNSKFVACEKAAG